MNRVGYFIHSARVALRALLLTVTVLLATVLLAATSASAEVSVSSEISPKSGHKDDLFILTVTIKGARTAPLLPLRMTLTSTLPCSAHELLSPS